MSEIRGSAVRCALCSPNSTPGRVVTAVPCSPDGAVVEAVWRSADPGRLRSGGSVESVRSIQMINDLLDAIAALPHPLIYVAVATLVLPCRMVPG